MTTTTYVRAYDVEYKIIIIGESRIGKTSILKRLETNQFHENTISTVGLDFVNFYHTIDNCKVKLQLWDTAGQERFRTITRSHFRNTKGIIFAFDISNKDTFDMLEYWFQTIEFDNNIENKTIVYLIGNKMDLEYDRDITYIDAKNVNYYFLISFHISVSTFLVGIGYDSHMIPNIHTQIPTNTQKKWVLGIMWVSSLKTTKK